MVCFDAHTSVTISIIYAKACFMYVWQILLKIRCGFYHWFMCVFDLILHKLKSVSDHSLQPLFETLKTVMGGGKKKRTVQRVCTKLV
jgi:hypothetical protein